MVSSNRWKGEVESFRGAYMLVDRSALRWQSALEEGTQKGI